MAHTCHILEHVTHMTDLIEFAYCVQCPVNGDSSEENSSHVTQVIDHRPSVLVVRATNRPSTNLVPGLLVEVGLIKKININYCNVSI